MIDNALGLYLMRHNHMDVSSFKDCILLIYLRPAIDNHDVLRFTTSSKTLMFLFVETGDCKLFANSQSHFLCANDCAIIRENIYISDIEWSNDFSGYLIIATTDFIHSAVGNNAFPAPILFGRDNFSPVIHFSHSVFARILVQIRQLKEYISICEHLYQESIIKSLFCIIDLELWNCIASLKCDEPQSSQNVSRLDKIMLDFLRMIQTFGLLEHNVNYYAAKLNISPVYLSRILKDRTGRTASQWISDYILKEVKQLLLDQALTIQTIADKTNFSDQASLSKFFKNNTGMSPLEYRRSKGMM